MEQSIDFRDYFDLETVETTSSQSGYPEYLKTAYTSDSLKELDNFKTALENEFKLEVEVVFLHKKDGWNLWSRVNAGFLDLKHYYRHWENEWSLEILKDDSIEDIIEALLGEGWEDNVDDPDQAYIDWADSEWGELVNSNWEGIVFYNPDDEFSINYTLTEDQNGYCYDTHHYKYGLIVNKPL